MTVLDYTNPPNRFKERIAEGDLQYGLWSVLADGYVAELLAGCGFDFVLIDAEHGPNDLRSVLEQLQGIAAAGGLLGDRSSLVSQPVVRLPHGDTVLIKQYLEIGVRNLLVPMVETADQAAGLVRATKYPPIGERGVGATLGRASQWGRFRDYLATASDSMTLILQIESRRGLDNIEDIVRTPGVDAVFFGPSDLAADFGLPGQPSHPEVVEAIEKGLHATLQLGGRAGIMLVDPDAVRSWFDKGITFAGVGVDSILLSRAADELLTSFKRR